MQSLLLQHSGGGITLHGGGLLLIHSRTSVFISTVIDKPPRLVINNRTADRIIVDVPPRLDVSNPLEE